MEYLFGTKPRTRVPMISESSVDGDSEIKVPYLGDLNDVREAPQALTGYDRANWFARNTVGAPMERSGLPLIKAERNYVGARARGVNGPEADDYVTDSYWTGYNVVNYPEQYTEQAGDVAGIWKTQTAASDGLNYLTWDQVYVDQDTYSVWS